MKIQQYLFNFKTFSLTVPLGLLIASSISVNAQIVPDRSLGSESPVVMPDVINGIDSDRIDGGAVRGSNLFQSFQEFNIGEGRGAYFSNPAGIANIFSRVTGGNLSQILGTLGVLGNANLYFLNPNGILFGPNSQLDIKGSFLATTADSFQFSNSYAFSASNPTAPPLLTVNIPIGLNFRANAQAIANQSQFGLEVGKNLIFVGGDINFDGGIISSPGSDVNLSSIIDNGLVTLQISGDKIAIITPDNLARGNITLNNDAVINVRGNGGGSINLSGNDININGEGARLRVGIAQGTGSANSQAGDLNINAVNQLLVNGAVISNAVLGDSRGSAGNININTRSLLLENGGRINASTLGQGSAGDIRIKAKDVILSGEDSTGQGSFIATVVQGSGASGKIIIDTSNLTLTNGSFINVGTYGQGNSGDIQINASDQIFISGESSKKLASYISNQVEETGLGKGGKIEINTNKLTLENGTNIAANTYGQGDAGVIQINAKDIVILTGRDSKGGSSYISSEIGPTGIGNSGGLVFNTSNLDIRDGGLISTSTLGDGNAGEIQINVKNQTSISGTYFDSNLNRESGGILAFTKTSGKAGNIIINTPFLSLTDGSGIEAFTQGSGNAGIITINAPQRVDLGRKSQLIVETSGAGKAGDITITTDTLNIGKNAELSATATNTATNLDGGGSITLNTQQLKITGQLGIFAETQGQSPAGNLTLNPNGSNPNFNLEFLDNGVISARTTAQGNGGSISLNAPKQINIWGLGKITTETTGMGQAGMININSQELNLKDGVEISASTFSQGQGGSINLNIPQSVFLQSSNLLTQSQGTGGAGNILINTGELRLENHSQISASTAISEAGAIAINANQGIQLNDNSRLAVAATKGGTAGSIKIVTPQLTIKDNSQITVSSPTGQAGNINIQTESLLLDRGFITAETGKSDLQSGANINLDITGLFTLKMQNESLISATAYGFANGGNITINTPFLLVSKPQDNGSDIIAKAFLGDGGKIQINALGIFGIQEGIAIAGNRRNDIDASSEYGAAGVVSINQAIDPNRGLIILPVDLVDPNALISQNACQRGKKSELIVKGRGGVPTGLTEDLSAIETYVGLAEASIPVTTSDSKESNYKLEKSEDIKPAQGWQIDQKGQVLLVNDNSLLNPSPRLGEKANRCSVNSH